MSYLSETGNLAAVPELRTGKTSGTPWCSARVIHNYSEKDQNGQWHDTATIAYDVVVTGRRAVQLVEAAQANGNIAIAFSGRYRVKNFRRNDGSTGIAYEVIADQWSVMPGQDVTLTKTTGTPAAEEDPEEPAF